MGLFDEQPIYEYTSDEAIEDGMLTEPYPDKFPGWIITTGVHEAIAAKADDKCKGTIVGGLLPGGPRCDKCAARHYSGVGSTCGKPGRTGDGRSYDQMLIPLLMDAQFITIAKHDHLHTRGLEGNVTGQAIWIGENEKGAYTLMFPSEY